VWVHTTTLIDGGYDGACTTDSLLQVRLAGADVATSEPVLRPTARPPGRACRCGR
jgi:hypothetical protein